MRRALGLLLTVVLAAAGAIGLIAFFTARDSSQLEGPPAAASGPGEPAPGLTSPELARGNVVLVWSRARDREPLEALARDLAGDDPVLRRAGQAVIVRRDLNDVLQGPEAQAFRRRLLVRSAEDPALQAFVEAWIGRGQASSSPG